MYKLIGLGKLSTPCLEANMEFIEDLSEKDQNMF